MDNLKRDVIATQKDVEEIKINMPRLFSFKNGEDKQITFS